MKKQFLTFLMIAGLSIISQAQVSINETGNDPDASAMLDVSSTSKGLLIPRMSSDQRMAITNPANGLMVFDITTNTFWFYVGSTNEWEEIKNGNIGAINDLADAKTDSSSVFIGEESGVNDNGDNVNVGVGKYSLRDNQSGVENTATGYGSLAYNISGENNTAAGSVSLALNETGSNNTGIGQSALAYNVSGSENTAIGSKSLLFSTGNQNTAIGKGAGQNSSGTSSGNIFIGYEAGKEEDGSNKLYIENSSSSTPLIGGNFETDKVDINGSLNVADNLMVTDSLMTYRLKISNNAGEGKMLVSDATGNATWQEIAAGATTIDGLSDAKNDNSSIYFGATAGEADDGNNRNTATGNEALKNNISGQYNVAMGYASLKSNTEGTDNVSIGTNTLELNTTGNENVAVGSLSLYNYNSGNHNTSIGVMSGYGSVTSNGSGNIFLGYKAGYFEQGSNKLYIENSDASTPLIGGDFETDQVDINGRLNISNQLSVGTDLHIEDSLISQHLKVTGGEPGFGKVLASDGIGNATWQEMPTGANNLDELDDAKNGNTTIYIGHNGNLDDGDNKNTSTGKMALSHNSSGMYNAAFGYSSMKTNTTGTDNTAVGYGSLELNTTGSGNTVIGSNALFYNSTGFNNTAIGYMAGYGNDTINGSRNVFIGHKAGLFETGNDKLYIANSGTHDPLIYGDFAQSYLKINGSLSITGGDPAQDKVLVSDANGNASWKYIDAASMQNIIADHSSNYNTALGNLCLEYNTQGNKNTALGYNAHRKNTLGNENTAIGFQTLYNNSEGNGNVALGNLAGYNSTSSNSIFIGTSAGFNATGDNQLYIDNTSTEKPLVHGDFENDKLQVNGDIVVADTNHIYFETPRTYTLTIHPSSIVEQKNNNLSEIYFRSGFAEIRDSAVLILPVNLPSNCIIKGFTIYAAIYLGNSFTAELDAFNPVGDDVETNLTVEGVGEYSAETTAYSSEQTGNVPVLETNFYSIIIDYSGDGLLPIRIHGATVTYEKVHLD